MAHMLIVTLGLTIPFVLHEWYSTSHLRGMPWAAAPGTLRCWKDAGSAMLFVVTVLAAIVVTAQIARSDSVEVQVSCEQSPVFVDLASVEAKECKKWDYTAIDSEQFEKEMDVEGQRGIDFLREVALPHLAAYMPFRAISNYFGFSNGKQRYGFLYLSVAAPGHQLDQPDLKAAVEAEAKFGAIGEGESAVTWRTEEELAGYSVQFYKLVYPDTELMDLAAKAGYGRMRECFTFFRNLDGSRAKHTRRITGRYCEENPISTALADNILQAISLRIDLAP